MKNLISILVILFSILSIHAQEKIKIGNVGKEEILYDECPFDKEAEAVVFFDCAKSYFSDQSGGFKVIFERTTRLKILKDSGIKWAEIEIPYYQSNDIYEEIYSLNANSYVFENGRIVKTKLNLKNSFDEKISENWKQKKFAIPNVKKGTIIEYNYIIESPYIFNLRDWEFQWGIPVLFSEYDVRMIPFYQYTFSLQGASKFDDYSSEELYQNDRIFANIKYHDLLHCFVMKDIPAFKDEEFITSKNDYITKLDFQLSKVIYPNGTNKDIISTWPLLIKDLLKHTNFGKFVSKCEKYGSKIEELNSLSSLSSQDKFDSVLNYVKRNYSWNRYNAIYSNKSPAKLLKDKFGNAAEINLLATGLLNAVGIKATPVLISTRENGKIKSDYPFVDSFNYVIIKANIDNNVVLSDATDLLLANNRLPAACLNDIGLVIQNENVEWLNLQPLEPTKTLTNFVVDLNDSISNAGIVISASEYEGLNMRKKLGSDISDLKKAINDNDYNVADSSITVNNMDKFSSPYRLRFTTEFQTEKLNDKIYISPFFNEVPKHNPLKQQTRTYPIDMVYPQKKTYVSAIKIPQGYKLDFTPRNQRIKNPKFEMDYSSAIVNDKLLITFYYFFKKAIYTPDEYIDVKIYYNEIIAKANEKISFVKL